MPTACTTRSASPCRGCAGPTPLPASHCGPHDDPALPPYGTRVRLKAGFPLDGYTGDALVILTAMKRYGPIWYVTGSAHPGWEDALDQLRTLRVRGSDFEVLASGEVTVC